MGIILSIFALLGGVGVFMTGMKFMSEGLEHGAGKGIQRLLGKISNNRFAGAGIGAAVTGIIQSSSATTVMVIGFVNAGIMTLLQATPIIVGVNVGTTVTGLISALSAFKVTSYFAAFAFAGIFIVMFSKKEKVLMAGKIMSGIGLIFIGLELMGMAFKGDSALNAVMTNLFTSISFPLLLVLLGMIFTAIIQSSSAFIGIILAMIGAEVLPLESALFIILGANIGTCITAILAAIGASVNAKRTAVVHLLFNITGTLVFVIFLMIFTDPIVVFLQKIIPTAQFQVAAFHTFFNVITALLVLPFVKQLAHLAEIIIPDKQTVGEEEDFKLVYVDERLLLTPPAAVFQLKKEVKNMSDLAKENLVKSIGCLLKLNTFAKDKIFQDEERINFINKGIAAFLIKLSSVSTSKSEEVFIGSLHHVISNIERIGDYAQNFVEETEEIIEKNISFSEAALREIKIMYEKIIEMYDAAIDVFMTEDVSKLGFVAAIEDEVDDMKKNFGTNHIKRLNDRNCKVDTGAYFYAVISGLERVADHLTNIAFSIKSPSGSQREAMAIIAKEQKARE
ncbi:MAG: Na/Pi cotransporter family protein [Clostridiales bacterium]|jgi:phosphate:Na+ symporter|nr:Na/Pi cotransporter family protein [Clostridiales bacterium]